MYSLVGGMNIHRVYSVTQICANNADRNCAKVTQKCVISWAYLAHTAAETLFFKGH
jgi:hypothetical protein